MKWIRTIIQLTPEQQVKLREIAYKAKQSVAAIVREAIKQYLENRS